MVVAHRISDRGENTAITVWVVRGVAQIWKESKTWNRDWMCEAKAGRSRSGEAGEK